MKYSQNNMNDIVSREYMIVVPFLKTAEQNKEYEKVPKVLSDLDSSFFGFLISCYFADLKLETFTMSQSSPITCSTLKPSLPGISLRRKRICERL